jgi:short-subunit dehydrogenase
LWQAPLGFASLLSNYALCARRKAGGVAAAPRKGARDVPKGAEMSFANQVAVITGASTGIGHALARTLAAEHCRVGLVARRAELLHELAEQIRAGGGMAEFAAADVGDRQQVRAALGELASRLGPVDLLIANAGVSSQTTVDPLNVADTEHVFRVNFFGALYAIEVVLPDMLRRRCGHLAGISSLGAYKGLPGESSYTASKAALNTYLEGLRIQLRKHGIAVTTVCPGFVRTPMTADNRFKMMPWLMDADEAARRIVRALKRRCKVYNFPWQTALLMKLTRWLPDRMIARVVSKYTETRSQNSSPRPPPRSGEGETATAPPHRFGEGAGGRGSGTDTERPSQQGGGTIP